MCRNTYKYVDICAITLLKTEYLCSNTYFMNGYKYVIEHIKTHLSYVYVFIHTYKVCTIIQHCVMQRKFFKDFGQNH